MSRIRKRWASYIMFEDKNLRLKKLVELHKADLSGSNLSHSNLSRTNLSHSDLSFSDLSESNLSYANLSYSDLSYSDLSYTNLSYSNLSYSNIEFPKFPTIRLLSSFPLGYVSPELCLELMRRDAYAHPNPELFDKWANGNQACPYQNEERFWNFIEDATLWKPGPPEMRDSDLILLICKEKGWKINGYL